jgi:hypothetical protein
MRVQICSLKDGGGTNAIDLVMQSRLSYLKICFLWSWSFRLHEQFFSYLAAVTIAGDSAA